jgi:GNAT superfamily N-acetyltransferase
MLYPADGVGLMSDLLVKLYDLPDAEPKLQRLRSAGVEIRRAMAYERNPVCAWVRKRFGEGWAGECEAGFSRQPVSVFLAIRDRRLLGFACYDCTFKGAFGPTGVQESERGQGIGAALLLRCLDAMGAEGYAYAFIGGAGELAFYERACGAVEIPGSTPGPYPPNLRV